MVVRLPFHILHNAEEASGVRRKLRPTTKYKRNGVEKKIMANRHTLKSINRIYFDQHEMEVPSLGTGKSR